MQILPEDLGVWRQVALARLRLLAHQGRHSANQLSNIGQIPSALRERGPEVLARDAARDAQPGFFARLYTGGLGLTAEAQSAVVSGMGGLFGGFIGGFGGGIGGGFGGPAIGLLASGDPHQAVMGAIFATLGAVGASFGFVMPRIMIRRACLNPVTAGEIETLLQFVDDPLLKDYLSLVREALAQPGLTADGQKNLRAAIHALGEAIDRLPPAPLPGQDAGLLRQELEEARRKATAESDRVVFDSLTRRIVALETSLRSVERADLLARRSRALRDEVEAQIEAVRMGIAALHDGAETGASFGGIADSVRRVSSEADSVADARNELNAYLTPPPVTLPTTDQSSQTLRVGQQN